QDLRELLARCGLDGDATRIIRGAALPVLAPDSPWETSVADLVEALEHDLTIPQHPRDGAPLLYIHRVFSQRRDLEGVLVEGRLRRGQLRPGDLLRAVGHGEGLRVKVRGLEMNHHKVDQVPAGE